MSHIIQQYQSNDAQVMLDVLIENETIWLTQTQIGVLFGVQKAAISKHLKNIFETGELHRDSVVSILETTARDGKDKIKFLQLFGIELFCIFAETIYSS